MHISSTQESRGTMETLCCLLAACHRFEFSLVNFLPDLVKVRSAGALGLVPEKEELTLGIAGVGLEPAPALRLSPAEEWERRVGESCWPMAVPAPCSPARGFQKVALPSDTTLPHAALSAETWSCQFLSVPGCGGSPSGLLLAMWAGGLGQGGSSAAGQLASLQAVDNAAALPAVLWICSGMLLFPDSGPRRVSTSPCCPEAAPALTGQVWV